MEEKIMHNHPFLGEIELILCDSIVSFYGSVGFYRCESIKNDNSLYMKRGVHDIVDITLEEQEVISKLYKNTNKEDDYKYVVVFPEELGIDEIKLKAMKEKKIVITDFKIESVQIEEDSLSLGGIILESIEIDTHEDEDKTKSKDDE